MFGTFKKNTPLLENLNFSGGEYLENEENHRSFLMEYKRGFDKDNLLESHLRCLDIIEKYELELKDLLKESKQLLNVDEIGLFGVSSRESYESLIDTIVFSEGTLYDQKLIDLLFRSHATAVVSSRYFMINTNLTVLYGIYDDLKEAIGGMNG